MEKMNKLYICLSIVLIIINFSESAPHYQVLEPRKGYVPVYIRVGDTPLNEINLELAAAFHENEISALDAKATLEKELMMADQPYSDSSDSISDILKDPKRKHTLQHVKPQSNNTSESSSESDSDELFKQRHGHHHDHDHDHHHHHHHNNQHQGEPDKTAFNFNV